MHPTPDTISNSSRVRQSQIANCKSQIPSLRNGFSLPELLVVIAILAVLISMLLPTVNKIRSTAVSIQCLSNIRQLTLTSLTYAAESDGWFPPFYYQPRSGAPRDWWYTNLSFRAMVGYTYRWPENFLCPLSRAVIAPNGWDYGAIQYSYGFNNSDAAGNGYSAPNPNNGPNRLIAPDDSDPVAIVKNPFFGGISGVERSQPYQLEFIHDLWWRMQFGIHSHVFAA